ncbi:MAG: hypothetical protein DRJ11_06835 [Candidatus Aminicenantes bacterium]|nr:MAG: hypothetical protein DRJ11_06835 [Candidatus Aminicenantes bacterium]
MQQRFISLGVILIFLISWPLLAQEKDKVFCPQVANYNMDIVLNPEKNIIEGQEILTWTNSTNQPTSELWFHLYWNAFQNNRSTYLQEAQREGRRLVANFKEEDWGYCRVESLAVLPAGNFTAVDLTNQMTFRQPDDNNPFDQTVFSVALPRPVNPGETIKLEIKFKAKVPRPISRTGVWKDYYFIAQWFPKIGVFENEGWNCHQYHAHSEYYADYGTYDVKITLPTAYIVGATGELVSSQVNGDGTTTHHFHQHSVHDFAWTASPRFLVFKEKFRHTSGKETEITLLLQPYHRRLKERYLLAVKNALKYCSQWFGEYPYSTVTCVDPAYNSKSGGMEYPTLFTAGAYFLDPPGSQRPEGVTIHEFGHGYFYGLVGTNEFEHPWMDEGFTSFLDTEVYYAAYGPPYFTRRYFGFPVLFPQIKIPVEAEGISRHRQTARMDIMQRFAWQFMSGTSYGANSYAKAELMLRSLKRFMGEEKFWEMMKTYSTRHWFKHPRPADFLQVVEKFAGSQTVDILRQLIYQEGALDYALSSIKNHHLPPPRGLFDQNKQALAEKQYSQNNYLVEILVRRLGEIKVPVKVMIEFADGTTITENWSGRELWHKFVYQRPSPAVKAAVDPEFIWLLDINRRNNSLTTRPTPWSWLKLTSRWLFWLQHSLEILRFLGS